MNNRIMQLLGANVGTGRGIRAEAATNGSVEVFVYDVIDPWLGISATAFAEAIRPMPDAALTIRLNSPGGDAFEGRAIASLIRAHRGPTRTVVDGLAASAASTIAIASNRLDMATGSFLMVHNAWSITLGNADDLEQTAALLRKVDGALAADYARRAGVSSKVAAEWMANETWFDAEEAVAAKLADAVVSEAAEFEAFNLAAYDHPPRSLTERTASARNGKPASVAPAFHEQRANAERRLRLYATAA